MSCVMTVSGKDLDIDEFVLITGLQPYLKKRKGEPRFRTKPNGEKIEQSVLSLLISDAEFNKLAMQIEDAILYFKDHESNFALLGNVRGIDNISLDFGVESKINGNSKLYETYRFPSKLLKLIGNLGIDVHLSIYLQEMDDILDAKTRQ